jgi:cytochrome c peroxidase
MLFIGILLFSATAFIDFNNLENYANQIIPNYIIKINTPLNNITTYAGATLGRVLFYDKNLSANNTISCSSVINNSLLLAIMPY